jgi:hypothetical protein
MPPTRELAASACQGKLGARAMVRLEPRVVTLYRVEWEYDGHQIDFDDGGQTSTGRVRRVRVKAFRNKTAAYRWMALRLIFARRDQLATRILDSGYPGGCRLCDVEGATRGSLASDDDGPWLCRYHDHGGEYFEQLRARLARWLRWRDGTIERANAC